MTNCRKLVSYVLALVMLLGMFYPKTLKAEDVQETIKTDVVIHKMKLKDVSMWLTKKNGDGTYPGITKDGDASTPLKYDGSKLTQLTQYFGDGAEELDGVRFTYWKLKSKEVYDKVKQGPNNKTVEDVEKIIDQDKNGEKMTTKFTEGQNGVKVEGLEEGYYWFIENDDTKIKDGQTVVEYKAAPFGLELPVYKADGSTFTTGDGNELHIYPKNQLAQAPKLDKNFTGKADVEGMQLSQKALESFSIGEDVGYEIKTKIPEKVIYKQAYWVDYMTEGLTVNKDSIKVEYKKTNGVEDFQNLEQASNYEVTEFKPTDHKSNGFKLKLTEQGLNKILAEKQEVIVKISYNATLNNKTLVDIPESNTVSFHYGNNAVQDDKQGNNSIPLKPKKETGNSKTIKVIFEKEGEETNGVPVKVKLVKAQDNMDVRDKTHDFNNIPVVRSAGTNNTHTFDGLEEDTEYKVKVENIPNGYDVVYSVEGDGEVKVKLVYTGNPTPLIIDGPLVYTYGKKFVKTDVDKKTRLVGAKFVIKRAKKDLGTGYEYLALNNQEKKEEIKNAREAIDTLITQYKNLSAEEQVSKGSTITSQIDVKIEEYKKKLHDATTKIKWVDMNSDEEVVTLYSNSKGQFEYKGLKKGTYQLEEIQAPAGYAKLVKPIDFSADTDTYSKDVNTDSSHIAYDDSVSNGVTKKDAQIVTNKKIVIPETGGMGTVLFTIVGSGLMALALFGMIKRRKKEEKYSEVN